MVAPPIQCDPDEIAALMRAGDLSALDRLTRCQGERLLAVGRRYCRDEQDARDAVQDALLTAGTHLADYRGEGSAEGWVVRMVARACGRMRRGRRNDPSLHEREVDIAAPPEDDPELLAGRARVAEALGAALLALPPKDRAVLLLAEAEGWTGPEIAAELGVTPNAVRSRLSRARRAVRERLEAQQLAPG
jgi:RNA polymerase sigma-70 factor (ECF subfamily)